jgi:hypothetical protein
MVSARNKASSQTCLRRIKKNAANINKPGPTKLFCDVLHVQRTGSHGAGVQKVSLYLHLTVCRCEFNARRAGVRFRA